MQELPHAELPSEHHKTLAECEAKAARISQLLLSYGDPVSELWQSWQASQPDLVSEGRPACFVSRSVFAEGVAECAFLVQERVKEAREPARGILVGWLERQRATLAEARNDHLAMLKTIDDALDTDSELGRLDAALAAVEKSLSLLKGGEPVDPFDAHLSNTGLALDFKG